MVGATKQQAAETRQKIVDAAKAMFHRWGVSRTSLDMVAQAAGVTRGAIYWHFKDKTDIFCAVQKDFLSPAFNESEAILRSYRYLNPLDAIEAALKNLFQVLLGRHDVLMVLEIMILRCEHVGEFAKVQTEIATLAGELLVKLEDAYRRAAATGSLHPCLDPTALAADTWAFTHGLIYRLLGEGEVLRSQANDMITSHMVLRRFA